MFSILGGTEARRLPQSRASSRVPWERMRVAVLVLAAVAVIVLLLVSSERATPFTGVKGETDTASMASEAQVLEPERAPVPVVAKEWPGVPDGPWAYTL